MHKERVIIKIIYISGVTLKLTTSKHTTLKIIALLDILITKQINVILHNQRLQKLEASWRGLNELLKQMAANNDKLIKIKLLNISWQELSKDLLRAAEFDHSQLFIKIYCNEFDLPGGEPFGLLIGDYEINHPIKRKDDMAVLSAICKVAASAFAPFVLAVDASFFDVDDYFELTKPKNLERIFQQNDYLNWKSLRIHEDARFIGLLLPRMLMRLPYMNYAVDSFYFNEDSTHLKTDSYLWGSPIYYFANIAIFCFAHSGWFADLCKTHEKSHKNIMLSMLPKLAFTTDPKNIITKYATEICITDRVEKELSHLGFISLCETKYSNHIAIYNCQSIQLANHYDQVNSTRNAHISTKLHYILCVARFAHYIKIIMRDKVGKFTTPIDCENYLQIWLRQYTASNTELSAELQAKYPLREAKVKIHEHPGKPGAYLCIMHIAPHYQFEQIESTLTLTTELK